VEGSGATDAELIRSSLDDPEAFVHVFDRHLDEIYRYLARRVGPDAGSDLASEVFTTAFAQRGRYDPAQPRAIPWLYGIAANLMRRHYRTEQRRLRAHARDGARRTLASTEHETPDPELALALTRLSQGDREVLLLFAWAGLEYEQIATALSLPVGTVRSRLHRARTQLRAELGTERTADEKEVLDG
jgi:RNA polymerase sigma-70 factor (ECF subfamily)